MAHVKAGPLALSINKDQALTVFEEIAAVLSESRAVISQDSTCLSIPTQKTIKFTIDK